MPVFYSRCSRLRCWPYSFYFIFIIYWFNVNISLRIAFVKLTFLNGTSIIKSASKIVSLALILPYFKERSQFHLFVRNSLLFQLKRRRVSGWLVPIFIMPFEGLRALRLQHNMEPNYPSIAFNASIVRTPWNLWVTGDSLHTSTLGNVREMHFAMPS